MIQCGSAAHLMRRACDRQPLDCADVVRDQAGRIQTLDPNARFKRQIQALDQNGRIRAVESNANANVTIVAYQ